MGRRLHHLNALKAFEAAARHLSFTKAAEELNVTQAAVSHHLKVLESYLGTSLFRRTAKGLLLSDTGQALLPVVRDSFDAIAEAVERLRDDVETGPLTISLRPYFAVKWLAPRLARFWAAHPQLEVRLYHTIRAVDFSSESVDIAILWGAGDWTGLEVELLIEGNMTPVVSPALLSGEHPIRQARDLQWHTLLHEETAEAWTLWLTLAGLAGLRPARELFIDDTNVRLEAAINGQGVVMGSRSMIEDDLAAGRLVAPFDVTLEKYSYYVVCPKESLQRRKVKAFRDWLIKEARR